MKRFISATTLVTALIVLQASNVMATCLTTNGCGASEASVARNCKGEGTDTVTYTVVDQNTGEYFNKKCEDYETKYGQGCSCKEVVKEVDGEPLKE